MFWKRDTNISIEGNVIGQERVDHDRAPAEKLRVSGATIAFLGIDAVEAKILGLL